MNHHQQSDHRKEAREKFNAFLKTQGLSNTGSRLKIVDAVYSIEGHFDIDELAEHLDSSVNRATVYRTIKLMTDAGLVAKVRTNSHQKVAYEHTIGHGHHDHLVCDKCGNIIEFYSEKVEQIHERIASEFDFELLHHNTVLTGICAKCRVTFNRNKSPSNVIHRIGDE